MAENTDASHDQVQLCIHQYDVMCLHMVFWYFVMETSVALEFLLLY